VPPKRTRLSSNDVFASGFEEFGQADTSTAERAASADLECIKLFLQPHNALHRSIMP
jgi:hypothetical protein